MSFGMLFFFIFTNLIGEVCPLLSDADGGSDDDDLC